MSRPARIVIHPAALQHNLLIAKQAAPHAKVMPALKADAYGHGMLNTALTLHETADGFMLACLSEALQLREAKITHPLLVIQGHQNLDDLKVAIEKDIRLVVHHESQLQLLDDLSSSKQVKVALKLDTGMHRLGIAARHAQQIYQRLEKHPNVDAVIWLMTHLACADDLDNNFTTQQLAIFDRYTHSISSTQTIANSAGILGWADASRDWVRPGIMLYGSSPFSYKHKSKSRDHLNLQATMTLTAPLIAINHLKKGDAIGYGSTWVCPENMQIGVVACGYADGYPRHAASGTPVWINGKLTRILGRVSMDLIVIDLNNIPAKVGQLTELWGENANIDEVANGADTISYELLCHAGASCQKTFDTF